MYFKGYSKVDLQNITKSLFCCYHISLGKETYEKEKKKKKSKHTRELSVEQLKFGCFFRMLNAHKHLGNLAQVQHWIIKSMMLCKERWQIKSKTNTIIG